MRDHSWFPTPSPLSLRVFTPAVLHQSRPGPSVPTGTGRRRNWEGRTGGRESTGSCHSRRSSSRRSPPSFRTEGLRVPVVSSEGREGSWVRRFLKRFDKGIRDLARGTRRPLGARRETYIRRTSVAENAPVDTCECPPHPSTIGLTHRRVRPLVPRAPNSGVG